MKRYAKKLLNDLDISVSKLGKNDDTDLYLEFFDEESVRNKRFYTVSAGGHLGFGCAFNHPLWINLDFNRPIGKNLQQTHLYDMSGAILIKYQMLS